MVFRRSRSYILVLRMVEGSQIFQIFMHHSASYSESIPGACKMKGTAFWQSHVRYEETELHVPWNLNEDLHFKGATNTNTRPATDMGTSNRVLLGNIIRCTDNLSGKNSLPLSWLVYVLAKKTFIIKKSRHSSSCHQTNFSKEEKK
jgi:hypothetical protein